MPYDHEQVEIDGVFVDKGMAPILKELWRLGYRTYMSCEDNAPEGYAWISFLTREDGLRFVAWLFEVMPADLKCDTDVRFRFLGRKYKTCCVRFPNRFLKSFTKKLKSIR